jgi:glycosidase
MGGEINPTDDGWTEDWVIFPTSKATKEDLWRPPTTHGTDRRKFAASLNILAPGTPFIYYGEEIGLVHNLIDYWSNEGGNDHHEFTGDNSQFARAMDDTDFRGPMWWSNSNRIGTTNPPENRRWSLEAKQSRYGNGVEEQMRDYFSLLRHYIRLGNLKNRHPFIAWGEMELFDTGNNKIAAWYSTDNRQGSPTRGERVLLVHNTDYLPSDFDPNNTTVGSDGRQRFRLEHHDALWIDGVCARHPDWLPTINSDRRTIEMPPYTSAIIGVPRR